MITEAYSMDLYCRNQRGKYDDTHKVGDAWMPYPAQFVGADRATCRRQARSDGWVFHRDGDVSCRLCERKQRHD